MLGGHDTDSTLSLSDLHRSSLTPALLSRFQSLSCVMTLKVGLIGHGAIGKIVADAILSSTHGLLSHRISLAAILVQNPREQQQFGEVLLTADPELFFATPFDVCVECAGQGAVREHAVSCLKSGRNFLMTSIGALTNDDLLEACRQAAEEGNSQLQLASGAMPGLDWMSSSALEPGSVVTAVQTKPPSSWIGARFEPGTDKQLDDIMNFNELTAPAVLFEGSAREAAAYYPKNSNVLAMLALSTAGLDDTRVKLVADPVNTSMRQLIEYEGSAGKITLSVQGKQSPTNPRTSQVVPLSVIKALRNATSAVSIGV